MDLTREEMETNILILMDKVDKLETQVAKIVRNMH